MCIRDRYWVGAFAAILTAHLLADSCGRFTWVVALLAATAAGGLWALLPGLLNAYRNVNIIISGIMMNYIGTYMAVSYTHLDVYKRQEGESS